MPQRRGLNIQVGLREGKGGLIALGLVTVAALVFAVRKAFCLVYPDLAFTYPFISYDGFQWIADGLFYAGNELPITYRNPGLPFVIALLTTLDIQHFLPVLHVVLLCVFFFFLALLLLRFFRPSTVALTLLFFFFNFKIQTFFDFVLADPWAITFQMISIYYLHRASERPMFLIPSFGTAALSFLFQYAVAFTFPAYLLGISYVAQKREDTGRKLLISLALASATALVIVMPNLMYKWITKGSPFFSFIDHFSLVRLNFFTTFYYLFGFFGFLGIPAAVAVVIGFFSGLRERGFYTILYTILFCYAIFWVFLYVWHDTRFLLYLAPSFAFLFAHCIERFGVAGWYRWKGSSYQQRFLACASLPVLVSYGFFDQGNPFTSNMLPLTPQTALILSNEPITQWGGNVTVNVNNARLQYYSDGMNIPGISFLQHYPRSRRNVRPEALSQLREIEKVANAARQAEGDNYRIKAGGTLPQQYHDKMKLRITLRRDIEEADADVPLTLTRAEDDSGNKQVLFEGKHFKLIR